jgi:hypothetical protein
MPTSDITITLLEATPTLRGNKLKAIVNDHRSGAIANIALAMVEFYSSITNDFSTATKVAEGSPEAQHAGLIEELTYYYWARARNFVGSLGPVFPVSPTAGIACTAIGISGLHFGLANGKIVADDHSSDAAVASGALRISIKTSAGNDPADSADGSVYAAFRNPTVATGNYVTRQIKAPLTLTISSGSTMGVASASVAFRIWFVLFDDAGTVRLGAIVCTTAIVAAVLDESFLRTSVAEGGAGAADSAGVVYTSTAVTSKPFRIIGFMTWNSGLSTPGTWVKPDVIQMFGAGVKKPGDFINSFDNFTFAGLTSSGQFISDDTFPEITEGSQYFSTAFTASSPANILEHDALLQLSVGTISIVIAAIFQGSTTNAIASGWMAAPALTSGTDIFQLRLAHSQIINTTSAVTFTLRIGPDRAATITLNGSGTNRFLGGSLRSNYKIIERMA